MTVWLLHVLLLIPHRKLWEKRDASNPQDAVRMEKFMIVAALPRP